MGLMAKNNYLVSQIYYLTCFVNKLHILQDYMNIKNYPREHLIWVVYHLLLKSEKIKLNFKKKKIFFLMNILFISIFKFFNNFF